MKKLGLILFAFIAMGMYAMAQGQGFPGNGQGRMPGMTKEMKEMMVKNMTDRQVERLKLSEEQTAQMKVLNEALITQMMAQFTPPTDSVPRKELTREEMEKLRKEHEAKLNEMQNSYVTLTKVILSEEQFKEFEKMQKERPQGFGRPGQGGPGGRRASRMGNGGGFGN